MRKSKGQKSFNKINSKLEKLQANAQLCNLLIKELSISLYQLSKLDEDLILYSLVYSLPREKADYLQEYEIYITKEQFDQFKKLGLEVSYGHFK